MDKQGHEQMNRYRTRRKQAEEQKENQMNE